MGSLRFFLRALAIQEPVGQPVQLPAEKASPAFCVGFAKLGNHDALRQITQFLNLGRADGDKLRHGITPRTLACHLLLQTLERGFFEVAEVPHDSI